MGKIRNFRDLDMWKLAKEIALDVYQSTKGFPSDELYGLVSQMRRASISIAANIAEGFNRKHNAEHRQFLYIAIGSCAELETHIENAHDLCFIVKSGQDNLLEKLDHESKMLRNLIKRL